MAALSSGGGASVGEVAFACGFASAARFSHVFKEHYGVRAVDVSRGARAASASTMSNRTRDQVDRRGHGRPGSGSGA